MHHKKENKKIKVSIKDFEEDHIMKQEAKTSLFVAKVTELDEIACSDQTGRFPCVSSRGNKHLMVVCFHDANVTLIGPIKNRTGNELTSTLELLFELLEERDFKPKFHMMNNEVAVNIIKMIKRQQKNS